MTKFIPNIPHPIKILYGCQGSFKSTLTRKEKSLVDASLVDLMNMPKGVGDLAIQLNNYYLKCYDNLTVLDAERSGICCQAVTGGYSLKRKLYTNNETVALRLGGPVSFTGINVVASEPDLLDRSILLGLDAVDEEDRLTDDEVWASFNADKPAMLAFIFSTVSTAMAIFDSVKLDRLSRMSLFNKWGFALAEAAGFGGERFLNAYRCNNSKIVEEAIYANTVASMMITFLRNKESWTGMVSELLAKLNETAMCNSVDIMAKTWPKQPNKLSERLNEMQANLKKVGIVFDIVHRHEGKVITLRKKAEGTDKGKESASMESGLSSN